MHHSHKKRKGKRNIKKLNKKQNPQKNKKTKTKKLKTPQRKKMSLRNLLRESSEAESEFLDSEHEDTEIPRRIAVPPRGAVLTMRDVRAVRDGRVSLVVVEPQDYTTTVKLTARSARLRDFYPMGPTAGPQTRPRASTVQKAPTVPKKGDRNSVNERTGLRKGQGSACTGTGCDRWWIVNPVLVEWLKARTRWFRE